MHTFIWIDIVFSFLNHSCLFQFRLHFLTHYWLIENDKFVFSSDCCFMSYDILLSLKLKLKQENKMLTYEKKLYFEMIKQYLEASLSFAFELDGDKLFFDILFIMFMYSSFKLLEYWENEWILCHYCEIMHYLQFLNLFTLFNQFFIFQLGAFESDDFSTVAINNFIFIIVV